MLQEDVQNEEDAKVNPFTPFCGQSKGANWETTLMYFNFQLDSPPYSSNTTCCLL